MRYQCILCCLALSSLIAGCHAAPKRTEAQEQDLSSLVPLTPFEPQTRDGILVSIANDAILLSDFQNAITAVSQGKTMLLPSGHLVGGDLTPAQAQIILQRLIDQKVLEMKAADVGINVGDKELSQRIEEFLRRQNLTPQELEEQLTKAGKSMESYRQDFKKEVLKQELIGRVISPLVTITNDEVNSFYLQQTGSLKQVTAVTLRSLRVPVPEGTSDPLQMKSVRAIQQSLAAGQNFKDIVAQYTREQTGTASDGLLPPRPVAELPQPVQQQLLKTNVNGVMGPFTIGSSVFFFQYLNAEFGSHSDLKAHYETWKNKLLTIKFEERLAEYIKNERALLKINIRPLSIS